MEDINAVDGINLPVATIQRPLPAWFRFRGGRLSISSDQRTSIDRIRQQTILSRNTFPIYRQPSSTFWRLADTNNPGLSVCCHNGQIVRFSVLGRYAAVRSHPGAHVGEEGVLHIVPVYRIDAMMAEEVLKDAARGIICE